jgi:hypothetical protein
LENILDNTKKEEIENLSDQEPTSNDILEINIREIAQEILESDEMK